MAPDCSITSGATANDLSGILEIRTSGRTPVWTADDGVIASCGSGICGDPKISEFDTAVFVR